MSPALTASQNSWRCVHANDKQGWLALMADDVVIEDPIGQAYTNPDGKGRSRQGSGAARFATTSIGLTSMRVTCEETFPSSSPDEIAHILQLRSHSTTARQARCAASSRTRSTTQAY